MKALLLDTHVVLWWLATPSKLNRAVYALIGREPAFVSVISIWEMLLKHEDGRLKLPPGDLPQLIEAQGFAVLPLKVEHVQTAARFAARHSDPNDRMLVGTALAEGMTLETRDGQLLDRAAPLLGDLLLEA